MPYDDGLLSDEFSASEEEVKRRLSSELSLFSEINRFAVSLQFRLAVPQHSLPDLLAALLYVRTLENIQGSILLVRRGMGTQAQIVMRAAMESLFLLRAISRDPSVARAYERSDAVRRRKLFRKSQEWAAQSGSVPESAISEDLLRDIEEEIETHQAKDFQVENMARRAGLHDWYLVVYPIFSGAVHTVPRNLENHLHFENGQLVAISSAPKLDGLRELLVTASEMLLLAVEGLDDVFSLGAVDAREQYAHRLRSSTNSGASE